MDGGIEPGMSPEPNLLLVVVGVLLVGGGFLIGLALGRSSNRSERRVRELESELASVRSEQAAYRGDVSAHFGRSSELLRDMTLRYRSLYEHLADGARTLCPDKTDVLPSGGPEALLLAGAAANAAAALESADADGAERVETADLGAALAPVKAAVAPTLANASGNPAVEHADDEPELETDPLPDEAQPLGSPLRH